MALSAAVNLQFRNTQGQSRYSLVVVTGVTIYKGGLVGRVLSGGKARPCRNATTEVFAGVALSDKTGVSDGSVSITLVNDCEILITCASSVTGGLAQTTKLYAVDDASVTTASTLGPEVGTLQDLPSSTTAWVKLRQQAIVAAS
jgi:hypothetical protein